MNEIDQLRADIEQVKEIMLRFYKQDRQALGIGEMYDRLAQLEAEAADPFWEAKETYIKWTGTFHGGTHPLKHVADYVQHLEREASISRKNLSRVPDVYVLKNLKTGKFQSRDRFFEEIELYTYREKTRMQWLEGWCFVPYTGQEP